MEIEKQQRNELQDKTGQGDEAEHQLMAIERNSTFLCYRLGMSKIKHDPSFISLEAVDVSDVEVSNRWLERWCRTMCIIKIVIVAAVENGS